MSAQENVLPIEGTSRIVSRGDRRIGSILADEGCLDAADIQQVMELQHLEGLRFGDAALRLGLIKVAEIRHGPTRVDEYSAIMGITFLVSALTSYLSIRYSNWTKISARIEQLADVIFLGGLVGITLVATLFAYEVI